VTVIAFAGYLVVALLLDFKYFIFPGDAMSRMANGFYVLYSRDPHLAAIGFVWTPLTSLCDIVLLLFKGLWPDLATHDVAGSLTTVCAMSGAVYQVWATLLEWRVARVPRLVLVALFALNPMIVFYGANGMSEALYVFTLVATARYLMRWIRDPSSTRPLVYSAFMLALAFLGRNEAVAAAVFATVLVFWVAYRRPQAGPGRFMATVTDCAVFGAPFVVTFVGWALIGWILTGQLLAQFSVNSQQVSIQGVDITTISGRLAHEAHALVAISPLLAVAAALGLAAGWRRRDPQPLAVVAVLGGCLLFSLVSYDAGSIFPWFRFYILCVPIGVLLFGYAVSPGTASGRRVASGGGSRVGWPPAMVAAVGTVAALVVLGPSLPSTARGMLNPVTAPEETQDLGFVFHKTLDAEDIGSKIHYAHVLAIARYIGDMRLPDGSVLVDNTVACIPEIIVTSSNAKVFVIPNDRDYQRVLADPITFDTHFVLVPPDVGLSSTNVINKEYPGIYRGAQPYFALEHSFEAGGSCPALRLFRVTGHTGL